MNKAVRGQGLLAVNREGSSPEVGNPPPGLGDQEASGSRVPGVELELPEPVEAPAGETGQVQGRGSVTSISVTTLPSTATSDCQGYIERELDWDLKPDWRPGEVIEL